MSSAKYKDFFVYHIKYNDCGITKALIGCFIDERWDNKRKDNAITFIDPRGIEFSVYEKNILEKQLTQGGAIPSEVFNALKKYAKLYVQNNKDIKNAKAEINQKEAEINKARAELSNLSKSQDDENFAPLFREDILTDDDKTTLDNLGVDYTYYSPKGELILGFKGVHISFRWKGGEISDYLETIYKKYYLNRNDCQGNLNEADNCFEDFKKSYMPIYEKQNNDKEIDLAM